MNITGSSSSGATTSSSSNINVIIRTCGNEPQFVRANAPHNRRATFDAKYEEKEALGRGGFGQVFAGLRRTDNLPVAIKHIDRDEVYFTKIDQSQPLIPMEVAIMQRIMANQAQSQAALTSVALLDWYDLDDEVILILEHPIPCMDMRAYIDQHGGSLTEDQAQVIVKQLVAALLDLEHQDVFHRDIKLQNVLIETGGDVPRVRIIDFGLSTITGRWRPFYSFCGTSRYIPPEFQTYGMYASACSTVWQLGALLYDTLHQKEYFSTKLFTTKQQRIRRGLSKDCRSFLKKCLSISPMERSTLEQLLQHPWMK